jgi:outer membrane lipoprotein SlyB
MVRKFDWMVYWVAALLISISIPHTLTAQTGATELKNIEGIVTKVEPTSITVKNDDGEVTLSVTETTEITLSDKPASLADLKDGQQVMIVTDGNKAVSIKVGTQSA